ncbi:hypothetical protein [Streptomyces sp. NBC_00114]|uniref:hypothetical protein n=1 Tax=Streptomyces sp. NBC_00114 TaxID=2975656 RepID=UPI00386FED72
MPAGAPIRLAGSIAKVEEVAVGGVQITADVGVDIRDGAKPACVAQPVFRFHR